MAPKRSRKRRQEAPERLQEASNLPPDTPPPPGLRAVVEALPDRDLALLNLYVATRQDPSGLPEYGPLRDVYTGAEPDRQALLQLFQEAFRSRPAFQPPGSSGQE